MSITTAAMLWQNPPGSRFAIKRFIKEGSAIGRKYVCILNGQWKDLDAFLETIITQNVGSPGYHLSTLLNALPNFSNEARTILVPLGVTAYARTPKLESTGEGDKADLTLIFEEGLQEGGSNTSGDANDSIAITPGTLQTLPADTTFRFVWEPNDVDLAYGAPFRGGYKWDLTIQAPRLDVDLVTKIPEGAMVEKASGSTTVTEQVWKASDMLKMLGYDPTNISLMAVCNIWKEGALTEQQRGLLFQYLNYDAAGAGETGAGYAAAAFVLRHLRGETSYRYWVPHVSVTRRYRTPPNLPGVYPLPGTVAVMGTAGGPPAFTGAPGWFLVEYPGTSTLQYKYLCTGPQVEFVGDQWQVECQWSGFLDFDEAMYDNPTGNALPID